MYFQFVNHKIRGRRESDFLCTITDQLNLLIGPWILQLIKLLYTVYRLLPYI